MKQNLHFGDRVKSPESEEKYCYARLSRSRNVCSQQSNFVKWCKTHIFFTRHASSVP